MTPQESSMLQDLIRRVQETQLTEKDPEAEQLLEQALGRNPDAIYILAQTVLVQNLALNQARAQLQQLQQQQQQPPQPARATSFLGSLLGHRNPAPPAPPQYQAAPPQPQYQPQYQQVPVYEAPPQYAPPAPSAAGGFLRSAATTAAGVAAGAFAFEGIESLMHGFGHGGGGFGGGGYGSGFGAPPVEETVVNNYYDEPRRDEGGFGEHREREASFDDRFDRTGGDDYERGGERGGHEEPPHLSDASYDPGSDTSLGDSLGGDYGDDNLSTDFGSDDSNLS